MSTTLGGGASMPEVIVARMDVQKGEMLRAQAASDRRYIVEPDLHLIHAAAAVMPADVVATPQGPAHNVKVRVVNDRNQPMSGAMVQVYGTALPSQGTTDDDGEAEISVFGETVRAIFVKPAANCWDRMVMRPDLSSEPVIIQLRPLSETFPQFPERGIVGWGQSFMQLDRLDGNLTGRGIKIGIIDSGCDNTHPQLRHVQSGFDLTEGGTEESWTSDTLSHGTHCAGIIAAASEAGEGIRGFAPDAEIHAFKVFPGGRFSDLIDALDKCIELGMDVVNMSLGSEASSELVTQKLMEARRSGVACIVAAGNSGGPVQFPGNLSTVLTVSAVGKLNQYPPDSGHALTVLPGGIGDTFPAKFSCVGPQVALCGPGVAIVSCVPGGYAAWDGTSMAAPHVSGLAALVLAHHPSFQGRAKQRIPQRVDQLFQILRGSATPCVIDVNRGGAGMPNAVAAVTQMPARTVTGLDGGVPGGVMGMGVPEGAASTNWVPQQQQALWAAILSNPAILLQLRAAGLL